GESVTEGTVTRWLKQEGETVEVDEPLLEVSTDKVDTEIPSPAAGTVEKIMVAEDETVDVGTELALIGDGSGAAGQHAEAPEPEAPAQPEDSEQSADNNTGEADTPQGTATPEPVEPAPAESAPSSGDPSSAPAAGTEVKMPALGESVTEGTVTRWLKQEGETVEVDEALLEVSTDKVDTEIPSPAAGTLLKIAVGEDETVDVGTVLATIGQQNSVEPQEGPAPTSAPEATAPAASAPAPAAPAPAAPAPAPVPAAPAPPAPAPAAPAAPAPAAPAPAAPAASAPAAPAAIASAGDDQGAYVTPLVRKLAAEHGVDLASLTGTGIGGRIRKQDVIAAAAPEPTPEPAAATSASDTPPSKSSAPQGPGVGNIDNSNLRGTTEKITRLRKVIASRMVQSLQTAAQLTTVVEVDITRVARLRNRVKADFASREGVKLSFLPFFALAAIEALKVHPVVNSTLDMEAGTITYPATENLGIAVDSNRGLVVPVIKDAGDLNLAGLARKIADLASRTRDGSIGPDDLSGGTFTLTNTGSRGALFDTPIINAPQSAILGTGVVVKRPAVISDPDLGEIVAVRSIVYLALSYDHQVVDGADAARFLGTMKERLEAGQFEADLGV
ncbi:MAG: 2-oxoglutarate dehydrogenase, E2 component, dihydrolipoamide succinyltransferase, partial [Antricoccus sp.]